MSCLRFVIGLSFCFCLSLGPISASAYLSPQDVFDEPILSASTPTITTVTVVASSTSRSTASQNSSSAVAGVTSSVANGQSHVAAPEMITGIREREVPEVIHKAAPPEPLHTGAPRMTDSGPMTAMSAIVYFAAIGSTLAFALHHPSPSALRTP